MKCLILSLSTLCLGIVSALSAYLTIQWMAGGKYQDLYFVLMLVGMTASVVVFGLIIMLAKEDYI